MVKRISINKIWDGSNTDCFNCSIRSSALFSGLTEQDFELLHEPVEQLTLSPGEVLYKMEESGHHLYTIRSGLVKLVQYLPDGSQRIVRLAQSTDVLGLEMMVESQYKHEAVALRTTEICRYPMEAVTRLSQHNPVLHKDLMARWQKALTEADAWLTQLSTGSAKKRMANLLLRLARGTEPAECYLLSREDVGSILSITVETASRMISDFKRSGLLTEKSHNHFLLDTAALEAVITA